MLEINDVVLSIIAPRYCVLCGIEAFTLSVDISLQVLVLGMLSGSLLGNLILPKLLDLLLAIIVLQSTLLPVVSVHFNTINQFAVDDCEVSQVLPVFSARAWPLKPSLPGPITSYRTRLNRGKN